MIITFNVNEVNICKRCTVKRGLASTYIKQPTSDKQPFGNFQKEYMICGDKSHDEISIDSLCSRLGMQ